MVVNVTDEDFENKVIKKSEEIPVVVDFWSQWCPPCNMLGPILEKVAEEQKEKFILVKANTDEARTRALQYGVMSIPNVKMFKKGKIVDGFVGAIPEESVKEWLDKNLD